MNTSQSTRLLRTRWLRFRLISLFAAMTGTALLIWFLRLEPTSFQGPALLLLIEIIAALAMTEILTRSPPQAVRQVVRSNSIRGDGSWSSKRASIEHRALGSVRFNMWVAFLLAFTVANCALYFVNTQAKPLSSSWKYVYGKLFPEDPGKKQPPIPDDNEWDFEETGAAQPASKKQLAIQTFAIVGGLGLIVSVTFIVLIRNSYFFSLREYLGGASARSFEYEIHDRLVRQ